MLNTQFESAEIVTFFMFWSRIIEGRFSRNGGRVGHLLTVSRIQAFFCVNPDQGCAESGTASGCRPTDKVHSWKQILDLKNLEKGHASSKSNLQPPRELFITYFLNFSLAGAHFDLPESRSGFLMPYLYFNLRQILNKTDWNPGTFWRIFQIPTRGILLRLLVDFLVPYTRGFFFEITTVRYLFTSFCRNLIRKPCSDPWRRMGEEEFLLKWHDHHSSFFLLLEELVTR